MRVKIGKYKNWIGPYQITDWFKPIFGEDCIDKFQEGKVFDKLSDWAMPFLQWVENKKVRKEEVHIDKWDSWSADHTLSLIIVPVLEQLKEDKHGSPFTEDEDVPDELRSTSAKPLTKEQEQDGELDEFFHQRFEWILDEMIWAMQQIRDDNWESQYHTGKSDYIDKEVLIPADENDEGNTDLVMYEMIEGPKHTARFDKEGYTKHHDRIKRGTTLFGKYFQNLWD